MEDGSPADRDSVRENQKNEISVDFGREMAMFEHHSVHAEEDR